MQTEPTGNWAQVRRHWNMVYEFLVHMQRIINVVSYPSSGKGFLVFALSEILSMNVKGGSTNGFIFWDAIWFCC